MSKNEQDVSKREQYRSEREARIKALRNSDGSKKRLKQKTHKKRNRAIFISVSAVLIIIALIYISTLFGLPQRSLTAATVGNQDIKVTEYNYAYFSTYNTYNQYFGGGGLLNLRESSQKITGQDKTWGEFFRESAERSLHETNVVYQKAVEAGYKLDDAERLNIDGYFTQMKGQMGTPLNFEIYLENTFGKGMNEKVLRSILEKQSLAAKFAMEQPETYKISEADIEREYNENKKDYDIYTYLNYLLITPSKDAEGKDLSTEDLAKKKSEYEDLAKKITTEVKQPEDLAKILKDEKIETDEKFSLDSYMNEKKPASTISDTEVKDWLTDDARKAGDMTYIASGNNFKILYFAGREKDTRHTADAIVASFAKRDQNGTEYSADEIAKIRTEAEKKAGELKTEQDFKDYDAAVKEDGVPKAAPSKKYENVVGNELSSFESKVLNYILSPEVKTGETKVIETDYAVYLVLVDKVHDTESWHQIIETKMKKDSYAKDFKSWLEDPAFALKTVRPGIWMTGK